MNLNIFLVISCILFGSSFRMCNAQGGPDDLRVPLSLASLRSLPQPKGETSEFYKSSARETFFSRVTILDLLRNTQHPLQYFLDSTVYEIIDLANTLYNNGDITTDELYLYRCGKYCYQMELTTLSFYDDKYSKAYLSGTTVPPIKVNQLHDAVVKTLEKEFHFNMMNIENDLGMSSFNLTENEWEGFVEEIIWYAIRYHADMLQVNVSDLAQLVEIELPDLLKYDLQRFENDFINEYNKIQSSKDVLYNAHLREFVEIDMQIDGSWRNAPLYDYIQQATNFTLRDLEILYNLTSSQMYALEYIPLNSYNNCHGVTLDTTIYNILQVILAVDNSNVCSVALVLSRSIQYVENAVSAIGDIYDLSVLGIFAEVSLISSWDTTSEILELDYDVGLPIDAQRIRDISKYSSVSKKDIESLSVPQIVNGYLSDRGIQILVKDYQHIFNEMLLIYGFTDNDLLKATQMSIDELRLTSISNAHHLLLDTIYQRYNIQNLAFFIDDGSIFYGSLNVTSTLPSSQWAEIVSTAMQGSFNQIMSVFFGDLGTTPDGIIIKPLSDSFQSISTTDKLDSSVYVYNISDFASCLLQLSDVHSMNFRQYHTFYNNTLVSLIKKKIVFETESLSSMLASRQVSLHDINDEPVIETIRIGVGFSPTQLRCMYGWGTSPVLDTKITWDDVQETRLCESFLDRSLFNITMVIDYGGLVQCDNGSGDACVSCHSDAYCDTDELTCICNTGFTGDGISCADTNECIDGSPCHSNANCQNTIGSYSCTCINGFKGDGDTCTDRNECTESSPCHPDANCQNLVGSYSCSCKNGFTGDGKTCSDRNECTETSPCHSNANCQNTKGSYSCSCKNGFKGDGQTCTAINTNTCQDSPCHSDASCTSTGSGSYQCSCKIGFTGDGLFCSDENECTEIKPCHSDANCRNTIGSYSCTCRNGFTGDGETCTVSSDGAKSSSNSNLGVIIGSAVGGVILLLVVLVLVTFFLLRRKSAARSVAANESKEKRQHHVENAAYRPDPRRRPQPPSEGGYEEPHDYARLESARRVPVSGSNYEGLNLKGQRIQVDEDNDQYAQLSGNRQPDDSGDYTQLSGDRENNTNIYGKLNQDGKTTPSAGATTGLENKAVNEPIYEELP